MSAIRSTEPLDTASAGESRSFTTTVYATDKRVASWKAENEVSAYISEETGKSVEGFEQASPATVTGYKSLSGYWGVRAVSVVETGSPFIDIPLVPQDSEYRVTVEAKRGSFPERGPVSDDLL